MDSIQAAEVAADHIAIVCRGFTDGFNGREYPDSEIARYLADPTKEPYPSLFRLTPDAVFMSGVEPGDIHSEALEVEPGPLGIEFDLRQAAFTAGTRAALTLKDIAARKGGRYAYTVIAERDAYLADGLLDVEGVSVLYQTCHQPHTITWAFADRKRA